MVNFEILKKEIVASSTTAFSLCYLKSNKLMFNIFTRSIYANALTRHSRASQPIRVCNIVEEMFRGIFFYEREAARIPTN